MVSGRNLVKGKVMAVSKDKTRSTFANCATFADAERVSTALNEAVPRNVHETVVEMAVNFSPMAFALEGDRARRYEEIVDEVEGSHGIHDLIRDLSNHVEFAVDAYGLEWGVDVEFFDATENSATLLLEYLLDDGPDSLAMDKLAILALLDSFTTRDKLEAFVVDNFDKLPLTDFVRTAFTDGAIDAFSLAQAEIFADAFMQREEVTADEGEEVSAEQPEKIVAYLGSYFAAFSKRSIEEVRRAGVETCDQMLLGVFPNGPVI